MGLEGRIMAKWLSTGKKGIRAREHPSRQWKGRPDLYYTIRLKINGRLVEEGLGYASEGWNLTKAEIERDRLRQAYRTVLRPWQNDEHKPKRNEKNGKPNGNV